MFKNYFKIAWRNLLKNKTFSLINIVGLAVSMSVGILLISMTCDIKKYDDFHAKKDRIYRVIANYQSPDGYSTKMATSPVLAARKIKAELPAVDDVVILQHGFGGEFQNKEKALKVEGLWAEPSLFNIFSFQLIQGDPARALNEPNSIVLTETSAKKLFGEIDPMGKVVVLKNSGDNNFIVTGVLKDIPKFSHIQFDALGSFSTIDKGSMQGLEWNNIWSDYTYLTLHEGASSTSLQSQLTQLSAAENKKLKDQREVISLELQPLSEAAFGKRLENQMGPNISSGMFLFILALAIIVIVSACFNYTNLTISRSLKRSKEVGIRKLVGAEKLHVFYQLIIEAIVISLVALLFGVLIFTFIRPYFLSLNPNLSLLLDLSISPQVVLWFIALALFIGFISGLLPGFFYSKLNITSVLKSASTSKIFGKLTYKKVLITVQFTVSLVLITSVAILYKQYKDFVSFDLGFKTQNILNIKLNGNDSQIMSNELGKISGVSAVSKSFMITSVGNNYYCYVKHNSLDSSMAWYNKIDENYIPVLGHKLIAGRNLKALPQNGEENEVVVNETLIDQFAIADKSTEKAVGQYLEIDGKKLQIVGVVKDFNHNTVEGKIKPFLFRYAKNTEAKYINAKIISGNLPLTMEKLEMAWKKIDPAHPFEASFYNESIRKAYNEYSSMIKIIGYLSFLAIVIASLGLFGMVIITTESKQKEIGVRKILGANTLHLMYYLSKNFLFLILLSSLFALPIAYLILQKIVLSDITYHSPIGMLELFSGFLGVMTLAILMIGYETFKVSLVNPVKSLRTE